MKRTNTKNVVEMLQSLIETEDGGQAMLAARLGVSPSSLTRWLAAKHRPQPSIERRIRSLAVQRGLVLKDPDGPTLFQRESPSHEADIRLALTQSLRRIREVLHSTGRLSSRHEALDEIAKLLFAHIISIDTGGPGIGGHIISSPGRAAHDLRGFAAEVFRLHLPVSLSHELTPSDFALRIKDSETRLALSLVECFDKLASAQAVSRIRDAGNADLLNDTFGQFVVDSFYDEKELGQYLTPPEVVRFMVRIGLASLQPAHLADICNPESNATEGIIFDPSCGVGSFLAESMRALHSQVHSQHGAERLSAWVARAMASRIVGIDKSERMVKLALTNLALFGAPAANLHLANSLDRAGKDGSTTNELKGRAYLILTNPPFGAEFHRRDLAEYKIAGSWSGFSGQTIDSEILFMERYVEWLAPGGVLVAVVPDSILTNQGIYGDLRRGLAPSVEILGVISLPSVTFAAAGTNTKTSILHLRKCESIERYPHHVYFAVCRDVGFDVSTRGHQRSRIPTGRSDLDAVLREYLGEQTLTKGTRTAFASHEARWDATFHAGLPNSVQSRLGQPRNGDIKVADVAELVNYRTNPVRFGEGEFQYIEISDIGAAFATVHAKTVRCSEAPSRARKLVKAGDVLVSTVRPERRSVGVVPADLDGAVCSTGIAVLRSSRIAPLVLARALQSDFVNAQLLRNNIGIAYPAIDEACLSEIVLPLREQDLPRLAEVASKLTEAQEHTRKLQRDLTEEIAAAAKEWSGS